MRKRILAILTVVLLSVMVLSTTVSAQTPVWGGTVQTTVTEPLVVKIGTTVLPDGYQFQAVTLKVGETKVYTLTVANTGTTAWLVKPTLSVDTTKVTGVFTNSAGVSIAAGASADFVLTLTAIAVTTSIPVAIGFTRE